MIGGRIKDGERVMEIVSDHGYPKGSLPGDEPIARFKNERDYIAGDSRLKTTVAAMDWAAAEIDRLQTLVGLADDLRRAQRAYMADRGNNEKGRMVGVAADIYDQVRGRRIKDGERDMEKPLHPLLRVGEGITEALERQAAEIDRLKEGLRMIVSQEYDAGYSPEAYADAVLSGHEPAAGG